MLTQFAGVIKPLKEPKLWLLGMIVSLTTLYCNLFWLTRTFKPLAHSLIFLSAVAILLWRKRQQLSLKSELFSSCLGSLLILFVLLKINYLTSVGYTVLSLPLIAGVGLVLLASGWRGLKQYWQELSILLVLAIPGGHFISWFLKLFWVNYLVNQSKLWLLCLTGSLGAVYLNWFMVHQAFVNKLTLIDKSLLAVIAVCWLLWQKRETLTLETRLYPTLFGLACFAFFLSNNNYYTLKILPFFFVLGFGFLTAGFRVFQQYKPELIICLVLGLSGILQKPLNEELSTLTTLTTDLTTLVLHLIGYHPLRQGNMLLLYPDALATLNVNYGCSGYAQITWLLLIAVIFLAMFPFNLSKKMIVSSLAIIIAFICNGIRIAVLTILVAAGKITEFHYWHEGEGSQLFSIISLFIFGSFCFYLIRTMNPEEINEEELDNL
ncbi:MAG: cyanoexosortase A [Crocosphaera sp.]|nr:cyanoexosortase A [Crocosphaera sp.]